MRDDSSIFFVYRIAVTRVTDKYIQMETKDDEVECKYRSLIMNNLCV